MRLHARTLAGTLAFGAVLAPHVHAGAPAARPASPLPTWARTDTPCGWSGAWLLPVGNRFQLGRRGPERTPPFRVNRGIGGPGEGKDRHTGADLSNMRGGDVVHAAAHGLVLRAEAHGWHGGYGRHVLIAHRLEEGGLVYSVYAHLAPESLRVRPGQRVAAGQPLGRVGRSGRASSEHLHFEVRIATDRETPWQKCKVVDPVVFVHGRLPGSRADTSAAAPYLEWAQCAAIARNADRGDAPLARGTWWRMLARCARLSRDDLPDSSGGLRQMLADAGVVHAAVARADTPSVSWKELARDLRRLRGAGTMVARPPLSPAAHRAACERRFASPRPSGALEQLGKRKGAPLLGEACMLLADACDPWVVTKKAKKRQAPKAARDSLHAQSVPRDSS